MRPRFEPTLLGRDEVPHEPAAVLPPAVPDDEHVAAEVPQQMRQEDHDLRAPDAAPEQPEVEVPPGHPCDGRECLPGEVNLQHGRLAPRRPGPHPMGALAQSALVDEDDRLAFDFGVFFSPGHRSRFHRRMAASFRSSARPAGRCGVQPNARSTRHAWTVEYVTPQTRSIRSATRHDVHRLVRYPRASGPRMSPCLIRRTSAVHRLAMHADPTRDIGFADIVLEQARRLQASPLQLHAIDRDTGWMSHASDYTRFSAVCHYVL